MIFQTFHETPVDAFLTHRLGRLSTQLGRVSSFPENAVLRSPDLYLTQTCDLLACHVTVRFVLSLRRPPLTPKTFQELHRVLSRSLVRQAHLAPGCSLNQTDLNSFAPQRSFESCRESTATETATFDYMVATSDFESQLTAWKERHTALGLRRLIGMKGAILAGISDTTADQLVSLEVQGPVNPNNFSLHRSTSPTTIPSLLSTLLD